MVEEKQGANSEEQVANSETEETLAEGETPEEAAASLALKLRGAKIL